VPGIQKVQGLRDAALSWEEYDRVEEIPDEWDRLAGNNIFLRKKFLGHLEQVNRCRQRYRLLFHQGSLKGIYVLYRLKLDVFTFSSLCLKFPVWTVGIPCSLSKQGFAAHPGFEEQLWLDIRRIRGAKLILNGETSLPGTRGETLPTCVLDLDWTSFEAYLDAMRSHYRYRFKKARSKWAEVKIDCVNPENFDQEMYRQYEGVYHRSPYKLEKLGLDFFRGLPLPAKVLRASHGGQVLGFVLLIENGDQLVFLFTGFDYKLSPKFDTYLNLLLQIVHYGIHQGFKSIDFGQTAEETKMRLGCLMKQRKLYLAHSNRFLDTLANRCIGFLGYQPPRHHFKVFKS